MDSVVCAISYAYCQYLLGNKVVPVLNFNRKDLKARKDVELVLKRHEISSSYLTFIDDLMPARDKGDSPAVHSLALVDHNALDGMFKQMQAVQVSGIIDHHKDENKYLGCDPRVISVCGSCSSLVFDYFYTKLGSARASDLKEVAKLCLNPLLLDTTNLKAKVQPIDLKCLGIYKELIAAGGEQIDTDKLFDQLNLEKNNISDLPLEDILSKDYKQFTSKDGTVQFGIASVVKSLAWLESKFTAGKVESAAKQLMADNGLQFFFIMTAFSQDSQFHRQLAVFSQEKSAKQEQKMMKEVQAALNLEKINDWQFKQLNLDANRKFVAPLVSSLLTGEEH